MWISQHFSECFPVPTEEQVSFQILAVSNSAQIPQKRNTFFLKKTKASEISQLVHAATANLILVLAITYIGPCQPITTV